VLGFLHEANARVINWFDERHSCVRLQFSKQKEDQQDYDYESKPAATIIASAIERPTANSTKAAE